MSHVHIVTDSTADIPPDVVSELGIHVVPCQIYLGKVAYRDGLDLAPPAFYELMAGRSDLPRTSQPLVADLLLTYQNLLDSRAGDRVISIHVGAALSGTVNAAWTAAQMLADPAQVDVVDSGQVSMGLGLAVMKAAEWARAGMTAVEVSRAVRALLPDLRVAAMIDSLDNLRKGGRIGQVAAVLGTILQIKPVLAIQDGQVQVLDRVRTHAKSMSALLRRIQDWAPVAELVVLHTGAEQEAKVLAGRLQSLVPGRDILIAPAGAALATHLGLGAVGACAITETA